MSNNTQNRRKSVQRSLRYEQGVCTICTRTMRSTRNTCKTHSYWSIIPSHTPNFTAIHPAVPEIWKTGAHVRTCNYAPSLAFVKRLANGSPTTYETSYQSAQPFPRYGKGGTSAPTPTHDPCNMHRHSWSLNTQQIWPLAVELFPIYSSVANFNTLAWHSLPASVTPR